MPLNDAGMVSGLVCGVLFGVVLENAGFGSPCKLTGQFRLSDWSVLKVMFTAIVVAAAGLLGLQTLGWMEADAVFVPSAMVLAAAVGGLLVGAGFAVGWLLSLTFSKTGLSFRFIRNQIAKTITTTLARNGIRHPHASSSSLLRMKNIKAQIAVALKVPQLVPIATNEEIIPRLPFGAYSASIVPAPEISAPAPNP